MLWITGQGGDRGVMMGCMPIPTPLPIPPEFASFTVRDAFMAGASRRRVRASDLQSPFWGIRSSASLRLTTAQRCDAFLFRMPDNALFSHVTAAALYGAPLPRRFEVGALHVGTPEHRRPVDARDIVGHRMQLRDDEYAKHEGRHVTTPERTWLDLATLLSLYELVAVGDYLIHWRSPLTTADRIADALERYPGRRARRLIRRALALLNERSESPRETWLRVILFEAGLPSFEANKVIRGADGRFIARVDLVNVRHRLILEYEGDHHRTDRAQWERDLDRISALEDEGWRVIRVTAKDLADPRELIARIRRHLAKTS